MGWTTLTQKSQRLEIFQAPVIPGSAWGAGKPSSPQPWSHGHRGLLGSQSPAQHPGCARARGLEMSETWEGALPPLSTQRPRQTQGVMLLNTLALPFPPVRISTFHFSLLLFCTAPVPSPASLSFSLSSSPPSGLRSPVPSLAPRASRTCASPLSRRGEAVQEMRPPLASGRGSR